MIWTNFFNKVLISLLVVALYACLLWPANSLSGESGDPVQDTAAVTPHEIDGHLLQSLDKIAPTGWHLMKTVRLFNRENLWEQIDGHADFFLSYDMVHMIFAEFTDSSEAGRSISVSIYNMGNPTNAFGVFSAERQAEIDPVDLGREGYRFGANLFIWKGAYYVRMITSKDSPKLQEITLLLAEKLVERLSDFGDPVRGLEMLPENDKIAGSEQYYRKDAMGLDFLNDTYMAQYQRKGISFTFFVTYGGNPMAAGHILDKYATYVRKFGAGTREISHSGVTITLCDMDGSYDAIFLKDALFAGATSIEDPELAVNLALEFWRHLSAVSEKAVKQ
jgi:hypothetical protein